VEGRTYEEWRKTAEALQAAKQIGEDGSLLRAATIVANGPAAPVREIGIRRDAALTIYEGKFESVAGSELGPGMWIAAAVFLNWGQREQAEGLLKRLESLTERNRHPAMSFNLKLGRAHLATWDGALERAVALAEEMVEQGQAEGREASPRAFAGRT